MLDSSPTPTAARPPSLSWLVWSVGFVSAGVLAFEIALMRVLLVASWHHFAFLVISIALLGFGFSGSILLFARSWLIARSRTVMPMLALLTAISMPLCISVTQHIPIEARLVPALLWTQIGWWLGYWAILTIPFMLGATAIGLGLVVAGDRVATVYAANLVGSGAGAALATAAMWLIDPAWLAVLSGAIALIGAAHFTSPDAGALFRRLSLTGIAVVIVAAWLWIDPPRIRPDPFKYASHLQRLGRQGDVQRLERRLSPRGVIEVYRGTIFHELPFLSLGATPPPMHALVIDGHWTGSILDINSADSSAALEQTMMSVPYALLDVRPDVLLLGERGGANVWLAARLGAARIDAVQPEPILPRLLSELSPPLAGIGALNQVVADPRQFAERGGARYDLIQLVSLEGSAAGSSGIAGLGQDYLITVEGIEACFERLKPQGILSVCRGIQTPPRDNLKLFATIAEALRRRGIEQPGRHVVIVRDYLAVCTMAKTSPWSALEVERVRELCAARQLTPVWFDGIRPDELNQPDAMPGPTGSDADWYHHAASELFGPDPKRFTDQWLFDIRPPADDRPFFLDFSRLRAIGALREAFGEMWLTRAELAYLFVLAAGIIITLVAVLTMILPLMMVRDIRRSAGRLVTTGYFGAIGLAYLMLEMTLLSRLTQLIGDPVLAASATITTFLVGSGIGSMLMQRITQAQARAVAFAVTGIVLLTAALMMLIGPVAARCADVSDLGRMSIAVAMMLPAALLMGMPMPAALRRLNRQRPQLVPWAWGVNGFASVLAAPLCIAIGMTWGFSIAAALAMGLYASAAILFPRLSLR